jgi:hypothetical protein
VWHFFHIIAQAQFTSKSLLYSPARPQKPKQEQGFTFDLPLEKMEPPFGNSQGNVEASFQATTEQSQSTANSMEPSQGNS